MEGSWGRQLELEGSPKSPGAGSVWPSEPGLPRPGGNIRSGGATGAEAGRQERACVSGSAVVNLQEDSGPLL